MLLTMTTSPPPLAGAASATSKPSLELDALSSLLAQLSFEHLHRHHDDNDETKKKREEAYDENAINSSIMDVFTGGFCLSSFHNEDMFFDALQDEEKVDNDDSYTNKTTTTTTKTTTLKIVGTTRGGFQPQNDGDEEEEEEEFHEPSQSMTGRTVASSAVDDNDTVDKDDDWSNYQPPPPPSPPQELPIRFLRAGKGDADIGQQRYEQTLEWRKQEEMDYVLTKPHPYFDIIKQHYPHYYHLRGRNNETVFFEQPPKTNLRAMREGGVTLPTLLRHYAMVTEFGWQVLERDDFAKSITVIDLEGMRMMDFVGECVDYVKQCSTFTGAHYPERAGKVIVVNVPRWFHYIWKVVRPMVDEVTLQKISILRGKEEALEVLKENIPIENIPPEYGGTSMPLGESPEEIQLIAFMKHNNALAAGDRSCGGKQAGCPYCSFVPARAY